MACSKPKADSDCMYCIDECKWVYVILENLTDLCISSLDSVAAPIINWSSSTEMCPDPSQPDVQTGGNTALFLIFGGACFVFLVGALVYFIMMRNRSEYELEATRALLRRRNSNYGIDNDRAIFPNRDRDRQEVYEMVAIGGSISSDNSAESVQSSLSNPSTEPVAHYSARGAGSIRFSGNGVANNDMEHDGHCTVYQTSWILGADGREKQFTITRF